MYNKVFISYATEDFDYAERLYDFLTENGFDPWMDKKKLLTGQIFDFYIQNELRNAHFLILLLSDVSVSKRGYIQKEFKQALKYCEEKLVDDIYLIPLKINSCDVPNELTKFQWIEFEAKDAFKSILQSLMWQRDKFIQYENQRQARLFNLAYKEEIVKAELGNHIPKQTYEIHYPQFTKTDFESAKELNTIIHNDVVTQILYCRDQYFNSLQYADPNDEWNKSDSTLYGNYNFTILNKNFISYISSSSTYNTGAAHGNFGSHGHNFLLNPLRNFEFESLFENYSVALTILCDLVHEQIMIEAKEQFGITDSKEFYYAEVNGRLSNKEDNFKNYYFTENSIGFIYNPYHLVAWVYGSQQPEISFDKLLFAFPKEKKLHEFITLIKEGKQTK
jgi:hypothetical protein